MEDLKRLYRDAIRDHAAHPVGYRAPIEATHRHEEYNPLCGDRVEILLRVGGGRIEQAAFDGEACAICRASASILCEQLSGQPPARLRTLRRQLEAALESPETETGSEPEALKPLLGVRSYPSRIRCATLPWIAADRALGDS